MITNTYVCDKCGKSVGEKDLYQLVCELGAIGEASYRRNKESKHICTDCLKKEGLLVEVVKPGPKGENEVDIEHKAFKEKVVDLLKELEVVFADEVEERVADAMDNY